MTIFMRLATAAALGCAVVFTVPVWAQAQAAPQADPAMWGLYTHLADTTRQATEGYMIRWHWSVVGREMVEEYLAPRTGKLVATDTITLGPNPGTLQLKSSGMGGKQWNGTVQPDGSVVYAGTGFLKFHFKAVLAGDGAYEVRSVKLRDGEVVSVAEPSAGNRYLPIHDPAAPAVATVSAPATQPTSAATSTVAAPARPSPDTATSPAPGFGFLDGYVGRSLVGNSADGDTFTLEVSREGNLLVLQRRLLDGRGYGRIVLRPSVPQGAFDLVEMWEGGVGGNRSAYLQGSPGAPATSQLDGYYGDPRRPGDLVLVFDRPGAYIVAVLGPTESGGLRYHRNGGNRRFGMRGKLSIDYADVGWFKPSSDKAVAEATSYGQSQSREREDRRREEARDRAEQQSRAQAALYDSLVQADAIATANEARSRAELDATLDQAARQAVYERQAQQERATAGALHDPEAENARQAIQRQFDIAQQNEARRQAQATLEVQSIASTPVSSTPASTPSGLPATASEHLMGFPGRTCADARAGAQRWVGAGGSFEIAHEIQSNGSCLVQINLDTVRHGGGSASEQ